MEIRRNLIRTGVALALAAGTVPALAGLEEDATLTSDPAALQRVAEDMPGVEEAEPLPEETPASSRRLFLVAQHDEDRVAFCLAFRDLQVPAGNLRLWVSYGGNRVEVPINLWRARSLFFVSPVRPASTVRFHLEIDGQEWGHADYTYPPSPGGSDPLMRDGHL